MIHRYSQAVSTFCRSNEWNPPLHLSSLSLRSMACMRAAPPLPSPAQCPAPIRRQALLPHYDSQLCEAYISDFGLGE